MTQLKPPPENPGRFKQPEQRRTEKYAGNHLSNNLRLPQKALAEPSNCMRCGDDQEELQEECGAQFSRCHGSPPQGRFSGFDLGRKTSAYRINVIRFGMNDLPPSE
jgi:hypothetical protein